METVYIIPMRRIVIVGASLAGLKAAEVLRREGFTGEVVVIGDEPHAPYDRPPLSKAFLASSGGPEEVELRQAPGLEAIWMLGTRAVELNGGGKRVLLDDGREIRYDGLVVATGAAARGLPTVPPMAGVTALRTLDDALALRELMASASRVAVIGTGFIGTEIASTCRSMGLDVTLVGALPVLHRPLGPLAGAAADRVRSQGVRLREHVSVAGLNGEDRVRGVRLDDGTTEPADVVVVAVGAAPVTDWMSGSGAVLDDGVVCDAKLAVEGLDDVVAAGDVARWPHPALRGGLLRVEHWTNATEQASAAARRLLRGPAAADFAPVPSFWTDQFGTRIQGVGLPTLGDEVDVVDGDPASDRFVAEYRRDGIIVGAVAAGSAKALLPYRAQLQKTMGPPLVM